MVAGEKGLIRFEDVYQHAFEGAKYGRLEDEEFDAIINAIESVPTVDAVEVVHAEWLDIRFDSMWKSMLATCSHCKARGEVRVKSNECGFAVPDSNHCPSCGAKMDGGKDNGC